MTRHPGDRQDRFWPTGVAAGGTIDTFIDAVYNCATLSELYKYAAYDGLGRLRARDRTQAA